MRKDHIVQAFDADLSALEKMITEMGGRVESQLDLSIQALLTHDTKIAKEVVAGDNAIDDLELRLAEHATQVFATRQPMAEDLRAIIAALKISSNLERMGDYAKNIAKRAQTLAKTVAMPSTSKSIARMGKLVEKMTSDVLDAYINRDDEKAIAVIEQDTEVDLLYTSLFRECLTYMMEDPRSITACTHLIFIAKNIERVGDHATNIAEQVYYIRTAKFLNDARETADKTPTMIVEETS